MTALADRVATPVERADFDDLVTLVTQAPPWEKDRAAGVRALLRAIGEEKAKAPDQILARWTWRLARAVRKTLDRKASQEFPEAKRLLGAVANSRGHRHEENVQQLVRIAKALPMPVGAALLASSEGYTPRANSSLDAAREELGEILEIATALADALPAPKAPAKKSRRRRRKKKGQTDGQATDVNGEETDTDETAEDDTGAGAPADGDQPTAEQPETDQAGKPAPSRSSRSRRRRRVTATTAASPAAEPDAATPRAAHDPSGSVPGSDVETANEREAEPKPTRAPRRRAASNGNAPGAEDGQEGDRGTEPVRTTPRPRRARKPAAGADAPLTAEGVEQPEGQLTMPLLPS